MVNYIHEGGLQSNRLTLELNQQKMIELNRQYEFGYNNTELIAKTRNLLDAYYDFCAELEKHCEVTKLQSYLEKAFGDLRHVTEFLTLLVTSAATMLSF